MLSFFKKFFVGKSKVKDVKTLRIHTDVKSSKMYNDLTVYFYGLTTFRQEAFLLRIGVSDSDLYHGLYYGIGRLFIVDKDGEPVIPSKEVRQLIIDFHKEDTFNRKMIRYPEPLYYDCYDLIAADREYIVTAFLREIMPKDMAEKCIKTIKRTSVF